MEHAKDVKGNHLSKKETRCLNRVIDLKGRAVGIRALHETAVLELTTVSNTLEHLENTLKTRTGDPMEIKEMIDKLEIRVRDTLWRQRG